MTIQVEEGVAVVKQEGGQSRSKDVERGLA